MTIYSHPCREASYSSLSPFAKFQKSTSKSTTKHHPFQKVAFANLHTSYSLLRISRSPKTRYSKHPRSSFLFTSSLHNMTSSNRRGRPPSSSVRALTQLELRRQLLETRHSVLDDISSKHGNVSPAPPSDASSLTSSSGTDVSATSNRNPRGGHGVKTRSAPVQARDRRNSWSSCDSLVPSPLNPRPHSPYRAPSFGHPTRMPTPTPPQNNKHHPPPLTRHVSHPLRTATASTSTPPGSAARLTTPAAIPATIAHAQAQQQDTALELAMVELTLELQYLRAIAAHDGEGR